MVPDIRAETLLKIQIELLRIIEMHIPMIQKGWEDLIKERDRKKQYTLANHLAAISRDPKIMFNKIIKDAKTFEKDEITYTADDIEKEINLLNDLRAKLTSARGVFKDQINVLDAIIKKLEERKAITVRH